MSDELKEKIVFELDASGVKGNSLSSLVTQLEQVETRIHQVNAALNGMKIGGGAARSATELEATIKSLQTKAGIALKPGDLSKGLGLDQAEFERFLKRRRDSLKGYQSELEKFASAPAAARAVSRFEREGTMGRAKLGDLLRPAVAEVHGGTMAHGATVAGKVMLEIPGAQVQASVAGPIVLNIPGSQIQGGGGLARNPETGEFVAGGGKKKKSAKQGLDISSSPNELQRVRTDTDKYLREAVTSVDEAGQLVTEVHDSVEGIIKTSRKTTTGTKPLDQFREARRLAEENFKQLRSAINPEDPGFGLAALQKKQGEQLLALLQHPFMKQVEAPKRQAITKLIEEQSLTLESKSIETFQTAQQTNRDRYYKGLFNRFTNQVSPGRPMNAQQRASYQASANQLFGAIPKPTGPGYRNYSITPSRYNTNSVLQIVRPQTPAFLTPSFFSGYQGPVPPKIPKPKQPPPSPFARGLKSFTPTGFAANLLNVSGWAAAVGVLYKSFELATYSLGRFVEVGQQTARLSVVFRGVGGSAKQLTNDVMELAAANGRETEEAMQSATEWSRLGLSRVGVNEAVRVSLEAANVAGMHAEETTKQLASLMHIYNLEVGDLEGVLGMLTTTSQRYNVTLEDLFQGLDRSAGGAKLAKIGLAELQGLIGTVVGKTGQSGTVVGNTLKSMFVQFSNPDVQQYLRRFGIETLTKEGGQKGGSQILQEMFTRWQSLDDRNKQSLTWRLVGRQNAARFVPVMDDYVQSQKMAIESQLNLNSAQEASGQILGTLKSQLAAVRAEWDRFVVNKGGVPGAVLGGDSAEGRLTVLAAASKNALRLLNGDKPGWSLMGEKQGGGYKWVGNIFRDVTRAQQQIREKGRGFFVGNPSDVLANIFTDPKAKEKDQFQNKVQQLNSQSGALAMRGRLMETIAGVLPVAKGDSLKNMVDVAASQMEDHGAALRKAMARGDIPGAQDLLHSAGKQAQGESLEKAGDALQAKTERLADLNLQLQNVNADVDAMQKQGAAAGVLNAKLDEQKQLEGEIRDLNTDRSASADAYAREAADVADVVEMKQQYLNLLKEEEMLMQGIAQLSEQQTLGTAGSRLDAQSNALTTTIELLKAQKDALDERGGAEDTQASEELRKQIADAEARKAALDSPQVQAVTTQFDHRQIASRRAREESDSYAVGYTEAEKLLNEEQQLKRSIGQTESQPFRTENDRVRIKEMEIALWQTQEKIQTRIIDLARQEKQIRIDSTREFQRNLLLAGPGEQLQRLYVSSLASRKIGAGEFNSLSPELKRMYYELQGGDAGAKTREEQSLLRGRGQTVEQEQAAYDKARGQVAFSGRLLDAGGKSFTGNQLGAMPAMPLPVLDPLVSSGRAAAVQLGVLGNSATRAAKALDSLPQKIDALARNAVAAAAGGGGSAGVAQPKLGIQPGYSLGDDGSYHQYDPAQQRKKAGAFLGVGDFGEGGVAQ